MIKRLYRYLIFFLVVDFILGFLVLYRVIDFQFKMIELGFYCFLFGNVGGITHCLRAIYLHFALRNNWDDKWSIWYFLRPLVSGICGMISMIFIKAGLLVFNGEVEIGDRMAAYLAVAFLAGYNVKNFLSKIEDVSKAAMGIDKKDTSGEV